MLYLDRGQSDRSFAMIANVGRRSPPHTNASGKLLLAHLPDGRIAAILAAGLERRTPSTITGAGELRAALARIRTQGYATCWQEQETGLNSIAVPVRDYTGDVCAALTLAGPSSRLTKRSVARLLKILLAEAAEVSAALGDPGRSFPPERSGCLRAR